MPRVLNYRHTHGIPDGAEYIGRAMPRYGLAGSKWRSPFKLRNNATADERVEVIAKYEQHLIDSGLINQTHELHGRDLVCWCAPKPCHGDVLLRLANK